MGSRGELVTAIGFFPIMDFGLKPAFSSISDQIFGKPAPDLPIKDHVGNFLAARRKE